MASYTPLEDIINQELVKQAEDILAPYASGIDYDTELVDMVERLTAIWYSGYEFGVDDNLSEDIALEDYEGECND
jgi:hypothetical protein